MPSSKGKPTDPKLREEVKEKVKNETNKDGSGKGQMTAWKANKLAKEYEKEGGGYENEAGSKNEPHKGAPEAKSEAKRQTELDSSEQQAQTEKDNMIDSDDVADKPKANSGKKATGKKDDTKPKTTKMKKEKKPPTQGTRRSTRIGTKRSAPVEEEEEDVEVEKETKKHAQMKKVKTAKK